VRARFLYVTIVVSALVPGGGRIAAQDNTTVVPTVWTSSFEYIGIENLRCDCTFRSSRDADGRMFVFRSAPMVTGVISGTPAAGLLMRGDTITQIDGVSILSVEGMRKFSNIRPGDDVNFLIRRRGNAMRVSIKAAADPGHRVYTIVTPEADGLTVPPFPPEPAIAPAPGVVRTPRPRRPATAPRVPGGPGVLVVPTDEPAEPAIPAQPAVPALPTIPTEPTTPTPRAPRALRPGAAWVDAVVPAGAPSPEGWFGFSIRCSDCGWASSGRPGESPIWESNTAPEISAVASGSPADRAGLKAGDRITHIDGISILTREGQRRFGRVKPRQAIRLTVLRDGKSLTKELKLTTRPEILAAIAARTPTPPTAPVAAVPPSMRRELRYSGKLENVTVEVFSPGGPTVERIGDTMIITTGASVVRIKVDPKKTR
jgi:hypothetical protein